MPTIPHPDGIGHAADAFRRRIAKVLRGQRDPRYAIVIMDARPGEEYRHGTFVHGNRTDLVYAATVLLDLAVEQERQGVCICPDCDVATAGARAALAALGLAQPEAN